MALTPAVFLDKDGTLIKNVPYNVNPELVELLPGVGEGLQALSAAGFKLVVVSNQSGIAQGLFPESALEPVWQRINSLLSPYFVNIAGFFYCPHAPGTCLCRKPSPALLFAAAASLGLDLSRSWMVGDILDDCEAGNRAGCRTILANSGGETIWRFSPHRFPEFLAADFYQVASYILDAILAAPTYALLA